MSLRAAGNRAEPPLPSSHLSQLETGKVRFPGIDMLGRLAQAYNIPVVEVLGAYGVNVVVESSGLQAQRAQQIGERVLLVDEPNHSSIIGFAEYLIRQQTEAQAPAE